MTNSFSGRVARTFIPDRSAQTSAERACRASRSLGQLKPLQVPRGEQVPEVQRLQTSPWDTDNPPGFINHTQLPQLLSARIVDGHINLPALERYLVA